MSASVAGLCDWIKTEALPLWASAGFDAASDTFVERLDFRGQPMASAPRRAMVQARQIYVYAHAALLGWRAQGRDLALAAAHRLIDRYLEPDGAPGWVYSIFPDGSVADGKRDLYAHAFALFGLAWAYRLSPEPRFLAAAEKTFQTLDAYFAAPGGGYLSGLAGDGELRDQNPHMHLFEAMLAWHESTGEARFLGRAGEIYTMMATRFFQRQHGVLTEYFDRDWNPRSGVAGRICEPGHHYEWSWLLRDYARRAGHADEPISRALKRFADRHGFDAQGLVIDELTDDGAAHKSSRRCWPQTEALKAEAAAHEAGEDGALGRAQKVIEQLRSTFLGQPIAGGWIDHVDASGAPLTAFMPASTLYHVVYAAAEAARVFGERAA